MQQILLKNGEPLVKYHSCPAGRLLSRCTNLLLELLLLPPFLSVASQPVLICNYSAKELSLPLAAIMDPITKSQIY